MRCQVGTGPDGAKRCGRATPEAGELLCAIHREEMNRGFQQLATQETEIPKARYRCSCGLPVGTFPFLSKYDQEGFLLFVDDHHDGMRHRVQIRLPGEEWHPFQVMSLEELISANRKAEADALVSDLLAGKMGNS